MLGDTAGELHRRLAEASEAFVTQELAKLVGYRASQPMSVRLEKPWWMPRWLFRRLLRSILVIEGNVEVQKTT